MKLKTYTIPFPLTGQHVPTKFYLASDVEAHLAGHEALVDVCQALVTAFEGNHFPTLTQKHILDEAKDALAQVPHNPSPAPWGAQEDMP